MGPLPVPTVPAPPLDPTLRRKALLAVAITTGGFLFGSSMAGWAIVGAAVITLVARAAPRPVFARVDGSLLLFFAGLFVVVEGAARTGAIDVAFRELRPWFGGSPESQLVLFGLFTQVASNVFSNVPFVLVAREWIPQLSSPEYQWTGLAMTSTLAGNLTIVGSVANLIVFELAGPDGRVSFFRFLRYGAVVTVATTALGFGVLLLEMQMGW
jgi:Na+/H+ antiporter NhaD/arsenite permease-like protein